jgi:hypothetical protein
MGDGNAWLTFAVALITAFGGAEFFKFLIAFIRTRSSSGDKAREAFDREKTAFQKKVDDFWAEQRKEAQSVKLENRTAREALNDLANRNGWLEGQLARCVQERSELEAEVAQLRERKHQ